MKPNADRSELSGRRILAALFLPCAALLASCGYNIMPPPPVSMPQSSAAPIPARVALMNVVIQDGESDQGGGAFAAAQNQDPGEVDQKTGEVLTALKQTQLFQDVERVGQGGMLNSGATIKVSYLDKTDANPVSFIIPPCIVPFVDLCILPLAPATNAIGAEVHLEVDSAQGVMLKSYSETSKGECGYWPFPGLFPFNLFLIPTVTHCTADAGPDAAFQLAMAKIAQDLISDRDDLADLIRQSAQAEPSAPAQGQAAPAEAPASAEKPWWQQ